MKLEARDISFRYGEGERQVLAHVDLTVESGERVGIMAPSGFGKTTLLKILAGYERPESGEVLLDGTPLERFRGYVPVQMIWQHPELSVNPARRLKTVLAEGDWPEDGGVIEGDFDATGLTVAPGFADPHVHFRDPGQTYKESMVSGCRASASGGYTNVLIMPDRKSVE